jgi:hypothetical protein
VDYSGTQWLKERAAGSGGSGVTTIGTFSNTSIANGGSISGATLTFGAADATNPGMVSTGAQTFAGLKTLPAPKFTGVTSAGANDSVLTIDPATGQTHWRTGSMSLFFANGLTAAGGDSAYLGGSLNQNTIISNTGFTLSIGGTGNTALFGVGLNRVLKLSNYTIINSDNIIYIDASAGADTVFLPASILASANTSVFTIVRLDNTNNSCVVAASTSVSIGFNGSRYYSLTSGDQSITVQAYNTSFWSIIGTTNPEKIKYSHTIFTPTTGGTVGLVNNQYNIINPAGTLATLTVNLPSSPSNNDVVYIKYTQQVSLVTYGNGTVVDGIAAPAAGGLVILTFDSGTSSWY